MSEVRMFNSLHDIDREQWNLCFKGEVEDYDYLLAVEDAAISGFTWRYITFWQQGIIAAAMPLFISDYKLDTTLQGIGKKISTKIRAAFPKLLTLKLACLGSPCTEAGIIGFAPQIAESAKPDLLREMLAEFEKQAIAQDCKLLGIKDVPESMLPIWERGLQKQKYASLPGMPSAYLDIDFADMDEYFTRLSYKTRKNMRQKLKSREQIRVEYSTNIDVLLPEVMALYSDTRNRSEWQFEELNEDYFRNVLKNMPGKSFCTLYYREDKLLAANLLIRDEDALLDKFFCMNNEIGRDYNLYFLSWFNNINYCLENKLKRYSSGQAYYDNKVKLGSKLTRNLMYFKHRNIIAQRVLKMVAPFLAADETIKEAA